MAFVVTEKMIEAAAAELYGRDLSGEPGLTTCEVIAEDMLRAAAKIAETLEDQGSAVGS